MFLACSYFFRNLSLNVLIKKSVDGFYHWKFGTTQSVGWYKRITFISVDVKAGYYCNNNYTIWIEGKRKELQMQEKNSSSRERIAEARGGSRVHD